MEMEGNDKTNASDKENHINGGDGRNHEQGPILASKKAKSCKGCLYYSSAFKSNSYDPFCAGITRSLPNVPPQLVGESEMEASKEGRSLTDFRYACLGYSVYMKGKDSSSNIQVDQIELPICTGLEVLIDKRVDSDAETVPASVHNKEGDGHVIPHPRAHNKPSSPSSPAHVVGGEFLTRFSRNATVVANGVVKNLCKVGNHIKERVDDILYPYRRRSK
ncbi:uncharacterized protein LOC124920981 [Impatiens glandulifera]|uniref:uncharacterized protein LOC124920981 n=1 Tax=Impatiens glandulifera TaxID=253017 RepID=UPI001FB115F5|nr:uncharacterized protein LOC124920981 [Impatiens glandulifera]